MTSTTISCKELIEMFENEERGKMKINYIWKTIHYDNEKKNKNYDCNIQGKDKYTIDSFFFGLSPFYTQLVKEEKKPENYKFKIEQIHRYQDPDLLGVVIEK